MTRLEERYTVFSQYIEKSEGTLLLTNKAGVVVYANRSVENLTGYEVPEVIGKKPGELWGGHMQKTFYKNLWDTISIEQKPFTGRVKNKIKNGAFIIQHLYIIPLIDSQGEANYFMQVSPHHLSGISSKTFESDFFSSFSQTQSPMMIQFLLKWLSAPTKGDFRIHSFLKECYQPEMTLSTLLYKALMQPEKEKFSVRSQDALHIQHAQSDPEAFNWLYLKYRPIIVHYFLRRCANASIAEDLTQETFIQAFTHIRTFHIENASYQSYLFRIAHNVLVSFYRRNHTEVTINENEDFDIVSNGSLEKQVYEEEIWESVEKYVSEIDAEILLLYYKEGKSVREISQILGKTENAVKLHLSRARKSLVTPFHDEGIF